MDWVKLHTRYFADPKVETLDDAAEVMFVRGLALAGAREQRGFIPGTSLPLLARRRRYERLVSALVAARLWTPVDGGYVITAWSDWQDAADALTERRTADRERQRRRRERLSRDANTPGPVDNSSTTSSGAARPGTAAPGNPRSGPTSRDIADLSRDVTATEGELEPYLQGVRDLSTAPSTGPPPRRCQAHTDVDGTVPPCGACADARRTHDTWQADHPPPPANNPLDEQQKAMLTQAETGTADTRALLAETPDPARNLAGIRTARTRTRQPGATP